MSRKENVELTNMCMICDGSRVVLQNKVGKGLIFPGGHVEKGEPFVDSVIREIKEETGLVITNPQLCGIKDWINEDGSRYVVMLYKTENFTGELSSSREGEVFWTELEELKDMDLIWNLKELLEIFCTDQFSEFYFSLEGKGGDGRLLG